VRVGLDVLLHDERRLRELRELRVGLLAHPASVTRDLVHALDALIAAGVTPKLLYGPEHGYGGGAQDMAHVGDDRDPSTGARVISLYGESYERLSPRPEELAEIDLLIIDLQDIGARYYTFVWTALLAARACAAANVRVLLLDRPNPIDGLTVEGRPHAEARLRSFVGLEAIPIRHGQTYGEIVRSFIDVEVIGVQGWVRHKYADAWDRPFVMPSPNMPTLETAIVYPGGCLIEATNLSEGRGTTRPFELVGAPWLDGSKLAHALNTCDLRGFRARPTSFLPTFQKHRGQSCGGVQLHVNDRSAFRPVATYLALLSFAREQNPERFGLRTETYEYVDPREAEALDLLCGTTATREALMSGASYRDVIATCC
jgi:uncharacterized protein YbbC (DUF1343 family)